MSWNHMFLSKPLCTAVLSIFILSLCPPILIAEEPAIVVDESDVNEIINAVNSLTPEEQQAIVNTINEEAAQAEAASAENTENTDAEQESNTTSSSSDSGDDVVLAVSIIAGLALLYWLFRSRHAKTAGFSDADDPSNLASVPLSETTSLEFDSGFLRQSSTTGIGTDDLSTDDLTAGSISFKVEF